MCSNNESNVSLHQCSSCHEVNMWSYWQGGIDCLDADIIVVGKDWGLCDDKIAKAYIYGYNHMPYPPKNDKNTDNNLCTLMKDCLGYDIKNNHYNKLFFTNFILCYRLAGQSSKGGFKCQKSADKDVRVLKNCSDYFVRLVNIINPKVIVCLEIPPYIGVTSSTNQITPDFRNAIGQPPQHLQIGNTKCYVFAVEQCGSNGANNRSKRFNGVPNHDTGWDLMKKDWNEISKYL